MNKNVKFLSVGLILALLSAAGTCLCIHSRELAHFSAVACVPSGVALTSFFLIGFEVWPWLWIGELLAYVGTHQPLLPSVFLATSSVLVYLSTAWMLKKKLGADASLSRMKDLFFFMVIAVIGGPLVGSALQFLILLLGTDDFPSSRHFDTWQITFFSQAIGILILGGFFIPWLRDRKHAFFNFKNLEHKAEGVFVLASILMFCALIFTPLHAYYSALLIKPYFLFALMLWAALRFDLLGATLTSLTMLTGCLIGQFYGFVTFSNVSPDPADQMIMLQLVIITISVTGLIVAVTVREKSAALDANKEFFDIASHELKTPITSLKLQLLLLHRNLDRRIAKGEPDEDQKSFLGKVDSQVNRLVTIVENLLDVSRAERGLIELDLDDVNLNELLHQLAERLSDDLKDAKCSLKIDLKNEIVGVWDKFRIEQTLENLLSNAIKYAPGRPIEVAGLIVGEWVTLKVKDHGPGIDSSKHSAIFDRFVRAGHDRHVQGLGLGLFITRRVIEAHGGTIHVESEPQAGATFVIELPLQVSLA